MLSVSFEALLSRADASTLEPMIGRETAELLALAGERRLGAATLRDALLRLRPPADLLRDPHARNELIPLLRVAEAQALADTLDLPEGNPFDELLAMRVSSRRRQLLMAFFGVSEDAVEVEDHVPAQTTVLPAYSLFEHQRVAAKEALDSVTTGERRVILHMPTGSGKTRTAMHVASAVLREAEPSVVIWLAYSQELCEQAASEFERAWQCLGDRTVTVARFWGDHVLDLESFTDGFLVAGLGKMYAAVTSDIRLSGRLGSRARLIIIDEAHQAIAPTYSTVLDALFARTAQSGLLGLTATPGRSWDDLEEDRELADFFARRKIELHIEGYSSAVEYLFDAGYLARPRFRSLSHGGGAELSGDDLRRIRDALDIPESILASLADDAQRSLQIIVEVESLARRHRRVLVFATTVAHAERVAAVLSVRGHVPARVVTAATGAAERGSNVRWYLSQDSEPRVLVNYGVLTTGFDAPATSAALIARPTKSLVLYSQMVGRATRGPKAGGNVEAEIVTVMDKSLPGFGSIVEAFENWNDLGWIK